MKKVTITGAGLVGSLWAVYLNKAGYEVTIYEKRKDLRKNRMSAGKSINLATSFRGWKALDEIGIGDEIRKIAIPMYGRTMHGIDGSTTYQPYGLEDQAIWSVSRGDINMALMDLAERSGKTKILFEQECIAADPTNGITRYKNSQTGVESEDKADIVFATDGAFSAVRYHGFQKLDRFTYSQQYIADGYREILLPANADGSYKLDVNTLHIWPRGRFMLIALPNFDGSFTCTLFMPFDEGDYCFNQLKSKQDVTDFFKNIFPDFYELMPEVGDAWEQHPLSSLAIVRCYPWAKGKTVLMGDAAHATVPFFGQGMNCGFEDCTEMWRLMEEHGENWELIFDKFQKLRKPNGDAVQDLSLHNYIVMRDLVADPEFQLLQRMERRVAALYPSKYFPLYSMVAFTDISYHDALEKGNEQEQYLKTLIDRYGINEDWSDDSLDEIIHEQIGEQLNL